MTGTIRCVLAVDDDPILLQVIKAFFARHGIDNVLLAANGAEARVMLRDHDDIDLILSDLHMPDMNGVELIEGLRSLDCKIPLLLISSADEATVKAATILAQAYGLNIIGSLGKPVNFPEIERVLGLPAAPPK